MVLIPAAGPAGGLGKDPGSPLSRSSPESDWYTPVMTLIRVDLPAPFSPTSAWMSPGNSLKDTLSRASTPGNRFDPPVPAPTVPALSVPPLVPVVSAGTGSTDAPFEGWFSSGQAWTA